MGKNKNELERYKDRMISMFVMSVKNDIEKWEDSWSHKFKSPYYEGYQFVIDHKENTLNIKDHNSNNRHSGEKFLCYIGYFSERRVWKGFKKLKKHFKEVEKEKQKQNNDEVYNNDLNYMKRVVGIFENKFSQQVRKDKLNNLK